MHSRLDTRLKLLEQGPSDNPKSSEPVYQSRQQLEKELEE